MSLIGLGFYYLFLSSPVSYRGLLDIGTLPAKTRGPYSDKQGEHKLQKKIGWAGFSRLKLFCESKL